mmetsp:Transcript_10622/g.15639  ORF Transcript_10622/g.15639 Transcript_10622/m.15639 type:complete len:136 (-) Transcript_10622:770-1177(-)
MSPLPPQTHPSTNNFPDKPVSAPETTQFKKRYYDSHQKRSPLRTAISGAFAGGLAKTIVAPIERIKLLMQLQSSLPQEYTKKEIIANCFQYLSFSGFMGLLERKHGQFMESCRDFRVELFLYGLLQGSVISVLPW